MLEKAEDFETELHDLIKKTIIDHKHIIFNGNGYDDAWIKEAVEVRGLENLRTTPDAVPTILREKNVKMLTQQNIYNETEIKSRHDITFENYNRIITIEANTMVDMVRKGILPAVQHFGADTAEAAAKKKALIPSLSCSAEVKLVQKLSTLADIIDERTSELEGAMISLDQIEEEDKKAFAIRDEILPKMAALRAVCDEAETVTSREYWPYPSYGKCLFGVK